MWFRQGGSRRIRQADVAKLADAPDLGSGGAIHVGSTPIIRTKTRPGVYPKRKRPDPQIFKRFKWQQLQESVSGSYTIN